MFSAITRTVPSRVLRLAHTRAYSQPPQPPTPPPPSGPSNLPSLDFSPQSEQQTGAKSSKDSLSSVELRRRRLGRLSAVVLALGFGINTIYLGREWEEEELKARKLTLETAVDTRWGRTKERFVDIFDYFNKPAWPELLPPPPPPPHSKPYTLLISIDDLLVTSTWDRQHGWRTAKRPGVDYFLAYISQFYEVVVFTTQNFYTAAPILDKLDRYNFYITHRLYREATRSINGKIVKDLSYLNRPLNTVILLDTNAEHIATHPENAIIIPKWNGDPNDKGLIAMIPFLESIGIYKPQDVRPILAAYHGKDIPIEYAKKEAEAKAAHVEKWNQSHPQGAGVSGFSSLVGIGKPKPQIPPTYLEQKRREAQEQYAEEVKYIREHKDYLEGLLKKEQEIIAKEVPATLWDAVNQITGEPPKKKPAADDAEERKTQP
ncbi:Mitochondrial import inner membrane translocase subunit TIM50 [Mycena indigotica]|uniref:Mitochondrial import inner membrane translocase subunit TIM50 n=1 Tax=Mycena indigotica TaxID=2126181 RepID=A0A8H6T299_9AGAR|nr:Mitochondrial import inner membrane translocase subunit TIM50 [Mycena indigotica]KAF7309668.1 Mitochondrial import inner membrane translocase subunit TIM50 [Mycena indigotica]